MAALQSPWMKRLAIEKDPWLQTPSESEAGGSKSNPWGSNANLGGNKSVVGGDQLDDGGNKSDSGGNKLDSAGSKSDAEGNKSYPGGSKSYAGGNKSIAGGNKPDLGGSKSDAEGDKCGSGDSRSDVGVNKSHAEGNQPVKESLRSHILPNMTMGFRPWNHLRSAAKLEEMRSSNPDADFPSTSSMPPELILKASSPATVDAYALARWKKPPRPPPTTLEHSSKQEVWLSLSTCDAASAFPAVKKITPISAIGEERKEMQLSWPLSLSMKSSYKQGLEASRASEVIESRTVAKANDVMPIAHKGTMDNSEIKENQRDEAIRGATSVSTSHVFQQQGWETGSTPSGKRSREIEEECEPLGSKGARQTINPHIWIQRWCRFARADKLLTRDSHSAASSLLSKARNIESDGDHEPHLTNSLPSAAAMALVGTASRHLHSIQPHQQRRRRGEESRLLHGTGSLSISSYNKCC